jgi:alpha-beta hydrolase superfamily lysophospholipase
MHPIEDALPSTLLAQDGLALHLHHWPVDHPKGVVQMAHGLCEHLGRFEEVAAMLNKEGWAVAGIDHRGHGRSGGARGTLVEADDLLRDQTIVYDVLSQAYRRLPHLMLGSSMGGMVAARFAAALAKPATVAPWVRPFDGVILIAPALEPTLSAPQRATLAVLARLVPDLSLPVAYRRDWVTSDPQVLADMDADPLMHYSLTPRISQFMIGSAQTVFERTAAWTVPTLLLYSAIDRLVTPAACKRFVDMLPKELIEAHSYADMAHDLVHEPGREAMYQHIRAWIGKVT